MAQETETLITKEELEVIHSVLERLDATGIEECSGDWIADLALTDYGETLFRLPKIAANEMRNENDNEFIRELGWLANMLYKIAAFQAELRQLAYLVTELHNARYTYIDLNKHPKK